MTDYLNTEEPLYASEPSYSWGGEWTEQKLDAFEKYVKAYLTIMNKYRDKYGWKLVYFDGFAGSGDRGVDQTEKHPSLFDISDLEISDSDLKVYAGAAERVVKIDQRGFDFYYFNEPDEESMIALQSKISDFAHDKRIEFRNEDANKEIVKLASGFKKRSDLKGLVFLDPFGMQVDWSSLYALKGCAVDLWILVPTGVIINRMLDKKGNLYHTKKLQKFFGLEEDVIKQFFYQKHEEQTLFGEELHQLKKIPDAVPKIAELYVELLKGVFKHVSDKPLVLRNTRGVPIFHFVFASNNPVANKIASQIIGKL